MKIRPTVSFVIMILILQNILHAQKVNILENLPYVDIQVDGKTIRIERIQDTNHKLSNSYTKTSRPTPPFDIQPFVPIEGIKTVSELDILEFLQKEVPSKKGMLIDARLPKWYNDATIPGSVNIPFILFSENNANAILPLLDATKEKNTWNFTNAKKLMIFCNGPWCHQTVVAMRHLVKLGYPKSKLFYYRGGMQYWQLLGLTTLRPTK